MHLVPATTYPAIVGRVLAETRKRSGIQQAQLAEALGVNQPAWSKIERGTTPITVEQLAIAAKVLHTTPASLLQRADLAVEYAEARGVRVEERRVSDALSTGLALMGAAALGALVLAALGKR